MTNEMTDPAVVAEVTATDADGWLKDREAILIDVREPQEYEFEHVPGSLLHPLSFLDVDVFPDIPAKRLVFICAAGKRSIVACKQLQKAGFTNLLSLTGGIDAWREAELDLEGTRFEAHDYMI